MKIKLSLLLLALPLTAQAFSLESTNKADSLIHFPMELLTQETTLDSIKADYLRSGNEKLAVEQTNYYFNQFNYQYDVDSKGKEDYWKTTSEFILEDGGDCEDFALTKYFHLVDLGVDKNKFRFYYVYVLDTNAYHMVLGYSETADSEPLLLDNMSTEVIEKSKRKDLLVISSFNDNGYFVELEKFRNNSAIQSVAKKYYNEYKRTSKKERNLKMSYFPI